MKDPLTNFWNKDKVQAGPGKRHGRTPSATSSPAPAASSSNKQARKAKTRRHPDSPANKVETPTGSTAPQSPATDLERPTSRARKSSAPPVTPSLGVTNLDDDSDALSDPDDDPYDQNAPLQVEQELQPPEEKHEKEPTPDDVAAGVANLQVAEEKEHDQPGQELDPELRDEPERVALHHEGNVPRPLPEPIYDYDAFDTWDQGKSARSHRSTLPPLFAPCLKSM